MTDCHSTTTRQVIKSKVCHEKWIKINTIHRPPSQKQLREKPYRGDQQIPWININGKWLEQAGFPIDQPVKIRVMDGCLVLTAETPLPP